MFFKYLERSWKSLLCCTAVGCYLAACGWDFTNWRYWGALALFIAYGSAMHKEAEEQRGF